MLLVKSDQKRLMQKAEDSNTPLSPANCWRLWFAVSAGAFAGNISPAGEAWLSVDPFRPYVGDCDLDVERVIHEIEQMQEMFEVPDIRPLRASDTSAANRQHDEMLAHSPWFLLWQHLGVCCGPESPVFELGEREN